MCLGSSCGLHALWRQSAVNLARSEGGGSYTRRPMPVIEDNGVAYAHPGGLELFSDVAFRVASAKMVDQLASVSARIMEW